MVLVFIVAAPFRKCFRRPHLLYSDLKTAFGRNGRWNSPRLLGLLGKKKNSDHRPALSLTFLLVCPSKGFGSVSFFGLFRFWEYSNFRIFWGLFQSPPTRPPSFGSVRTRLQYLLRPSLAESRVAVFYISLSPLDI